MRLVMLGLPGAGKGTQADLLAKELGIPRISTGDMFREALQSDTELGRAGQRVRRTRGAGARQLDGGSGGRAAEPARRPGRVYSRTAFPAPVPQAEALETTLAAAGRPFDAAVFIDVDQEEAIRRIAEPARCLRSAAPRTGQGPRRCEAGRCSQCGGPLVQRPDDTEETARHRLQVYMDQTHPV